MKVEDGGHPHARVFIVLEAPAYYSGRVKPKSPFAYSNMKFAV